MKCYLQQQLQGCSSLSAVDKSEHFFNTWLQKSQFISQFLGLEPLMCKKQYLGTLTGSGWPRKATFKTEWSDSSSGFGHHSAEK